jgi:hypothetical protein
LVQGTYWQSKIIISNTANQQTLVFNPLQKIHCSGSIQKAEDSSPSKSSPDVMMLYCQPFMLTGSDIVEDFKQNVFWSKHDMALKIKEFDKK